MEGFEGFVVTMQKKKKILKKRIDDDKVVKSCDWWKSQNQNQVQVVIETWMLS